MIRKFVYAKKPSNLPSHASHWTADGNDVTVHFSDGRDSVKLPHYHTPETLVKSSYNRDGDDSIVVESVEPWQAEVERLKGELAIAERDASLYRKLVDKPTGDLWGDAYRAQLLGMKDDQITISLDFLTFTKELIAERDAARAEATRFAGSQDSASAWKALHARGDLRGILTPTCRDDILTLVDQLKAKVAESERIAEALGLDKDADCDAAVSRIKTIQFRRDELQAAWSATLDLCRSQGMEAFSGDSGKTSILRHIRNQESANFHLGDEVKRLTKSVEACVLTPVKNLHGDLKQRFNMTEDNDKNYSQDIIAFVESLSDEIRKLKCDNVALSAKLEAKKGHVFVRDVWQQLKNDYWMPGTCETTYSADILAFVKSLKSECEKGPAFYLIQAWAKLRDHHGMPPSSCSYEDDILGFVDSLKEELDESQREAKQLRERTLDYAGTLSKAQSSLYQIKALADKGVS